MEEQGEETVMGIQPEEEADRRGLSPFSEEMLPAVELDDDEDPTDDVPERGDFLPSLGQCYYREIDGLINRIQELKETGFSPPYEKCSQFPDRCREESLPDCSTTRTWRPWASSCETLRGEPGRATSAGAHS